MILMPDHRGRSRIEIDGCQGLREVQSSGFSIQSKPIPIMGPEGHVTGLLHFVNQAAFSKGMDRPGGDEEEVPRSRLKTVEAIGDPAMGQGVRQIIAADTRLEADEQFTSVSDKSPAFCFTPGAHAQLLGQGIVWMDLDGKAIVGINELDQQREFSPIPAWPYEIPACVPHQVPETAARQGAIGHYAHASGMIREVPAFPDRASGEILSVEFHPSPAPYQGVVDGLESERGGDRVHGAMDG